MNRLDEIGNAGLKAYTWRFTGQSKNFMGITVKGSIDTPDGDMTASFGIVGKTLIVEFSTQSRGGSSMPVINLGISHALRITATIVEMAKELMHNAYKNAGIKIEKVTWDEPTFGPGNAEAKGQRNKLYSAFARKAFGSDVKIDNEGRATVKVPDKFYTMS